MYRVGLTGGIACGKTTICELFSHYGIAIIDADMIARDLVTVDSPCYRAIVSYFGSDCLMPDKVLNRRYLRQQIFSDKTAKLHLESILHPAIHQTMIEQSRLAESIYCLMVIPLLAESDADYQLDRVLVIDSPVQQQQQRLMARDAISAELAQTMIDQQVQADTRLAIADDVINNDNSFMSLKKSVTELHQLYQRLAREKAGSC